MDKKYLLIVGLIMMVIIPIGFAQSSERPVEDIALKDALDANDHKLSEHSINILKKIENQEIKKDFLVKYESSNKLGNYQKLSKFKIAKVQADISEIINLLNDNNIKHVELDQEIITSSDHIGYNLVVTNISNQWSHATGDGVSVGILDTGVAAHEDVNIVESVSMIGPNTTDFYGHGTKVAGVIAAQYNQLGVVGGAYDVDLYSIKVMNASTGKLSDALQGLEWAMNNSLEIVNFGFGMTEYSQMFKDAIQQAYEQDMLMIAPVGNSHNNILFPAAYDEVIAVGAVNENNELASFSTTGTEIELVAPGVAINTTSFTYIYNTSNNQVIGVNETYQLVQGTSFAAPHVTAIAALIKEYNATLTNEQIRAKLLNDAFDLGQSGWDTQFGYGLVQAKLLGISNVTIPTIQFSFELYNFTDYGLQNESLIFWTNGTGSYQNLTFNPGWYKAINYYNNLTDTKIFNVNETGIITSSDLNPAFVNDSFNAEGSSFSDGYGWINLDVSVEVTGAESIDDTMCINYNYTNSPTNADVCRWDSALDYTSCIAYSALFANSTEGKMFFNLCDVIPSGGRCALDASFDEVHNFSSTGPKKEVLRMFTYQDCLGSILEPNFGGSSLQYYLFDAKQANCTSDVNWEAQGRWSTSPDIFQTYKSGLSCNASQQCDTLVHNNVTVNASANINPCRTKAGNSCSDDSECASGLSCTDNVCKSESFEIDSFTALDDGDLNRFALNFQNTGTEPLDDIFWLMDMGDQTVIVANENISLDQNQLAAIFVAHNYTEFGNVTVVVNITDGTQVETTNIQVTISPPSAIGVSDFFSLTPTSQDQIITINFTNNIRENLQVNWSLNTTENVVQSSQLSTISFNESVIIFAKHNYSTTGNKQLSFLATNETQQTLQQFIIDVPDIEIDGVQITNFTTEHIVLQANFTNYLPSIVDQINWTFKLPDAEMTLASNLATLESNKSLLVFIKHEINGTGNYLANVSISNNNNLGESILVNIPII